MRIRPIQAVLAALIAVVAVTAILAYVSGMIREPDNLPDAPRFDRTPLVADLAAAGFSLGDRAHVRIFKAQSTLELWIEAESGRFELFRSYPICTYSGGLGPKLAEGDRQAPEGFYRIEQAQLNPNSRHHLAFNLGFPNAYDRQHGRTGSFLMVHGGCSSIGCYAMTDAGIDEIYAVVEEALLAGQAGIDVHIFPFQMTEDALLSREGSEWHGFWTNLQEGAERFALDGAPPRVFACNGRYVFGDEMADTGCEPISGWQA